MNKQDKQIRIWRHRQQEVGYQRAEKHKGGQINGDKWRLVHLKPI